MNTLLALLTLFSFHAAAYGGYFEYNGCLNPNSREVTILAIQELRTKLLPAQSAGVRYKIDHRCTPHWFDRLGLENEAEPGSFYSSCGIRVEFQNETQMKEYALSLALVNDDKDYIDVVDLYALFSVPVCGVVSSQVEISSMK